MGTYIHILMEYIIYSKVINYIKFKIFIILKIENAPPVAKQEWSIGDK